MNIMRKAYMRKQQHINHGLQIIDEDFESADEDEIRENRVITTRNQRQTWNSTIGLTKKIGFGY